MNRRRQDYRRRRAHISTPTSLAEKAPGALSGHRGPHMPAGHLSSHPHKHTLQAHDASTKHVQAGQLLS